MQNRNIQIQLLDQNAGYLDVPNDVAVPLNFNVGDIRDITKRSGSFSKTIQLNGTKNNAHMLNHYYEVNIEDGTFNVNKRQRCNILQNGVIVIEEAILQLVSVKKIQNNLTQDDEVTYEVVVKDSVADFFTTINGRLLNEIELPNDGHLHEDTAIIASWQHTAADIYKYVVPWTDNQDVPIKCCYPAIYAKAYWDQIHQLSGYSYDWADQTSGSVRFDKLVVPYNGNIKKLSDAYQLANTLKIQRLVPQEFLPSATTTLGAWASYSADTMALDQEISDPNNEYNPTTYTFVPHANYFPPDSITINVTYEFDLLVKNNAGSNVTTNGRLYQASLGLRNDGIIPSVSSIVGYKFFEYTQVFNNPNPGPTGALGTIGPATFLNSTSVPNAQFVLQPNVIFAPGETLLARGQSSFTFQATNLATIHQYRFGINFDAFPTFKLASTGAFTPNATAVLRIKSMIVEMIPSIQNGPLFQQPVDLNLFIPDNVKQSDFVKSICTMYNLYVEQDPLQQNRLIYKRRDQFYDQGRVVDWTSKLDRSTEQDLIFLPELTNKKLKLTYRYDSSDIMSKAYTDEVKETYGQIEYTYKSDFVKDTDVKEILFAPTINAETTYKQIAPFFGLDKYAPTTSIRLLYDGGMLPCSKWFLVNFNLTPNTPVAGTQTRTPLNDYPFFSHFDEPYNPTFDINFGMCDYYGYQLTSFTNNNLFYNNWLRTIVNVDTGRMLTAYFWLTESDINQLRLSDKVRIDNGYFYINKIIDYRADTNSLTKVELITMEQDTNIGFQKGTQIGPFSAKDWAANLGGQIGQLSGRDLKDTKIAMNTASMRSSMGSSVINSATNFITLGANNLINDGFRGVIIGDGGNATKPGYYVGPMRLSSEGVEYIGQIIMDGGVDQVMNLNKTTEADFIDGGEDTVRKWGGISNARPAIDGGIIN